MKPIRKHIYTVLPRAVSVAGSSAQSTSTGLRVRSNSASSRSLYTVNPASSPLAFFDSPPPPPPPTSRPANSNLLVSTRLAAEVKAGLETQAESHDLGQSSQSHYNSGGPPPYSLALTSAHTDGSFSNPPPHLKPLFPYSPFGATFSLGREVCEELPATPQPRRQRVRYHLDVGAYGIPKRSRGTCIAGRNGRGKLGTQESRVAGRNLAVQVGEDAYFVHNNAMGVADGVGGWSRKRGAVDNTDGEPSPSALFARRLMQYCAEEVDAVAPGHLRSHDYTSSFLETASDVNTADLYDDLNDSLDELEEGLDVLMILDKAYEQTMRAHVRPQAPLPLQPPHSGQLDSASTPCNADSAQSSSIPREQPSATPDRSSWKSLLSPSTPPQVEPCTVPVREGSSTALLAVLEHPLARQPKERRPFSLLNPSPRYVEPPAPEREAILRIAHLGDCMGMLIRGEEIVWRTEEMWWDFNTPVQLGPTSPTRPRDAQVFTVPVCADDILILASDGLSDNLWDEDILDEVVRFRKPFIANGAWMPSSTSPVKGTFGRSTLAAMLSEALCSRARRAAEKRVSNSSRASSRPSSPDMDSEVPFARRAREFGKTFRGGKPDDISVLVAVVSPVPPSH